MRILQAKIKKIINDLPDIFVVFDFNIRNYKHKPMLQVALSLVIAQNCMHIHWKRIKTNRQMHNRLLDMISYRVALPLKSTILPCTER